MHVPFSRLLRDEYAYRISAVAVDVAYTAVGRHFEDIWPSKLLTHVSIGLICY